MSPQDIQARVGENIGTSEWVEMSQERINKFAEATGDHQFIHIDPAKAALVLALGAQDDAVYARRAMLLDKAGDKAGLCGHAGGAADGGRVILAADHEHRP